MAFSADGRSLIAVSAQELVVWDVAEGKRRFTGAAEGLEFGPALAVAADGRFAMSRVDRQGHATLEIRQLPSGDVVFRQPVHGQVNSLAFNPDGRLLAQAGNDDHNVRLGIPPTADLSVNFPDTQTQCSH